jgi:hypothetical protein
VFRPGEIIGGIIRKRLYVWCAHEERTEGKVFDLFVGELAVYLIEYLRVWEGVEPSDAQFPIEGARLIEGQHEMKPEEGEADYRKENLGQFCPKSAKSEKYDQAEYR